MKAEICLRICAELILYYSRMLFKHNDHNDSNNNNIYDANGALYALY